MTVKDLIAQEVDIDVYDDVCQELGIAFCGPLELTESGEKHFSEVMGYEIKLHDNGCGVVGIVSIDDPDEAVWKERLEKAKEFFEAAAGYCSVDEYEEWFKDYE